MDRGNHLSRGHLTSGIHRNTMSLRWRDVRCVKLTPERHGRSGRVRCGPEHSMAVCLPAGADAPAIGLHAPVRLRSPSASPSQCFITASRVVWPGGRYWRELDTPYIAPAGDATMDWLAMMSQGERFPTFMSRHVSRSE